MKCLQNRALLVFAFVLCSTGLMNAAEQSATEQAFSPEVKTVCQKIKAVFADKSNNVSWRCFAGALFHYIGNKKCAQNDGAQSVMKNDPRFAELQGILAEIVDATNLVFIADKLSKYEYLVSGMKIDELAAILSQRIASNANDSRDAKDKLKCDYKAIIKLFENAPISAAKEL